jgi:hypothetical protein
MQGQSRPRLLKLNCFWECFRKDGSSAVRRSPAKCSYICTLYLQVDLHGTHRLPKGFTVVAYALNPQQREVHLLPGAARSIPSSMCSIGRRLEAGCGGRRHGKVGRICCQTQKGPCLMSLLGNSLI